MIACGDPSQTPRPAPDTGNRLAWVLAVLVAVALAGALSSGSLAQEESPPVEIPKTGMREGKITAKHDRSVEINQRAYAFHPTIVFADDEGRQREWKEFKKGDFVQYRLKQERIDFLILELPK